MNNLTVFTEIEALLQKIQFGSVDLSLTLHKGRIQSVTTRGRQSVRSNDNTSASLAIIERLKKATEDKKGNSLVQFEAIVRDGEIREVVWNSDFTKRYTG